MESKTAIYYDNITVKIFIPPGYLVELPLKSCVNTPFLNISTDNYVFKPYTKHHFIGLIKYIPNLILNKYQINLDSKGQNKLFQDYVHIYSGIYNNLVFNEGFITPDFYKYKSEYFTDITTIHNGLYSLINTLIKNHESIDFISNIVNSPAQYIWFCCLFNDLENIFFENGLLGKNVVSSKKVYCNSAIKNMNNRLDKCIDGITPYFDNNFNNTFKLIKEKTCNESYLLGIIERISANNDEILKKLKYYYRLKKQFFRKYRDNKNFQIGYITTFGEYVRGSVGKNTHNI